MNTKIFCDIADISSIKKFNKKQIVKGFTTNPSLMRKAGAKDYKSYSKEILKVLHRRNVQELPCPRTTHTHRPITPPDKPRRSQPPRFAQRCPRRLARR